MKNKSTLYTAKHKWTQKVIKAAQGVKMTGGRPVELLHLSHELYRLGVRGEELWDAAFDLGCTPEYMYLIGDHLGLIEDLSDQVYAKAAQHGIRGCRKYVNLKCEPRAAVTY